jgi:hypothetical protein
MKLRVQIGDVNIIRAMKSQNHINKSKKTSQPTLRELVLQLVSDVSYIKDVLKRNNLK